MGCCFSRKEQSKSIKENGGKKGYSWDKRENIDLSQYIIDGANDTVIVKRPGSINGQQFVIQNCKDTKIFLLDHTATVTVDDCIGCHIVIGPTNGSVFFRDCKECKCIVACQQFRTRDCLRMDFFLHCATQPIIESSAALRFSCYQLAYNGLALDFIGAKLSLFNNNWSNIHDFTPDAPTKNWKLIPENVTATDLISFDYSSDVLPLPLATQPSAVPLTRGMREKNYDEYCFVIVFNHEGATELALQVIEKMKGKLDLVQTKEVLLSADDAARIFGSSSTRIWESAKKGPLIGLEFNGDDSVRICAELVSQLQTTDHRLYSSPSSGVATREIENFYNFCNMQMTT